MINMKGYLQKRRPKAREAEGDPFTKLRSTNLRHNNLNLNLRHNKSYLSFSAIYTMVGEICLTQYKYLLQHRNILKYFLKYLLIYIINKDFRNSKWGNQVLSFLSWRGLLGLIGEVLAFQFWWSFVWGLRRTLRKCN